ncbi:MAG: polyprenyl synthetase family protein [Bacteroidales bacterium]|jgi:geranylgeranyl diphosphate synthase type II
MYDRDQLKEIVDKALVSYSYYSGSDKLFEPVKYAVSVGGKRLRPILTLMACNLFTDKINEAVMPAAGIEIFHNFSLVHDDIMDNASIRRNFPTVHSKYGINQAILSGDVMAFLANECFLQLPQEKVVKVIRLFNNTAIEVCQGQQMDMDFEKKDIVPEEDYIRMIRKKTAVLIAAALEIGAIIGGAEDKDSQTLYDFGINLGLAFQIQDDILDIWSDEKVFGKSQGGDIIANKKTLPIIKAFELASGNNLRLLKELYSQKNSVEEREKVETVTAILNELRIKEVTTILADSYIDNALKALKSVAVEERKKEKLLNITESLVNRNR